MDTHFELLEISSSSAVDAGSELSQVVRQALERALTGTTKLSPEVLAIAGMSGRKYRCFINNLVEQLPAPRYLEIGSWAGSTLCSAIFGNKVDAVAIDNWSQFGGPSDKFFAHLSKFKGTARVSFLEQDFRAVDYTGLGGTLGPFNVYLFDGPHTFKDQYDGVVITQPALVTPYVQIVDDWNWPNVRKGTLKAIADLGLRIEFMAQIRTSLDDQHAPPPNGQNSDWHNGYCISVLSRPA
jgi:hypothetical protein